MTNIKFEIYHTVHMAFYQQKELEWEKNKNEN